MANNMKKTSDQDIQFIVKDLTNDQLNQPAEMSVETSDHEQAKLVVHHSLLREARDIKKLSLQEVSNQLRISVKQIEALENGDFTNLPQPMIVRGFIRNYARLLGIDAAPVLDFYKAKVPEIARNPHIVKSNINQPIASKEKQSWFKYLLASGLVLLAVAAWLIYTNMVDMPIKLGDLAKDVGVSSTSNAQTNAAVESESTSSPEPLPEIALPAAERAAAEQPHAINVATSIVSDQTTTAPPNSSAAKVIELQPEPRMPNPTLAAANALVSNNASGNTINLSALNFIAKQETWINIIDVNGRVVYSKVLSPDSQDSVQVNPVALPVKVIVGNINGTSFSFNGNAVDLKSYAKVNVARFSLK